MRKVWWAAVCSGLLSACGGGGGGGMPVATPITITAMNQDAVAHAAASAIASLAGAGGGVTASDSASQSAGVGGTASLAVASRQVAMRLGAADASGVRKRTAAAGSARPLAITPVTEPCAAGGTTTVAFTDNDNDGVPEIGDTLTLSFANCKETASDNLSGSIAITLSSINVDANGLVSFAGAMTITQLAVTDGTRSAALGGNMTLTFNEDSATQTRLSLAVGSAGLTASVTASGTTETISYEPGFSFSETDTLDGSTGALVSASSMTGGGFSSSALGGRVILEPQVPVVQFANETYPRSGALRAVGNASALRLTVLSATTVRVELDANLDGTYEASKDVAWATLLPV